jgi:hypothetical protein
MSASTMTKGQWVELFREIGLDEDQMTRWHRLFEARYPSQHQAFLEWLGIGGVRLSASAPFETDDPARGHVGPGHRAANQSDGMSSGICAWSDVSIRRVGWTKPDDGSTFVRA